MVQGDADDMVEEKVENLKKKKKKESRKEEREKALKDGQQVKMKNSSKKEGLEKMLKCASRGAEKAATGNDLNGKVRGNKKKRKEEAVSLQKEECDPTLVEETDKGKCKESEKTSQTSAEEPVLEKKRKTQKLKCNNEFEEGGGEVKMRAGVLGDGGSVSKTAEEGKAERQKKVKKAKTAGEGLPPSTEHGQGAAKEGAGAWVAKKRSKKVSAEANNGEEKRDEIINGSAGSPEDKEGADGSGVLMSEKKRENRKTKKVKAVEAAADLGNGHMDTAEGDEEKSTGEKALEKERKKKRVPAQESRTGMGAGGEGEDGNKGIAGLEEPQEGNGEMKQLKKKNVGVSGPRGGEKEKRGKKGVMKGEKKREKGKAQPGEEDVAASVQEEEEERMKKNKKKRKAQPGEEDVVASVQEEEEERMKKNKKKRKAQPGEEDVAASVQEEEEERMKKNKKKRKAQPGEEDVAASVQEEEEERMKKNKKKRKAQAGEEDVAASVQEEEEERMKKNKKKRKARSGEENVAASVQEEERMKKNKKKRKAQPGEEDVVASVQEEEEERMKKNKKKRKAQPREEDVVASVQEEEEERMKKNKKKRKAQAKGGDTAVVIQETMKEANEKERAHSGSGEGQSGSQEIAPSKGRRKSEGGQEAKTSSEGSAVMEDQEGGVLNRKQKKKRRNSDRGKVACEDGMRTETPKEEQGEAPLTSQSRRKKREGTPAEEVDVVFLSEKMGNKDEVTIDQERRQALQDEIDKASCPKNTQMLGQWGTAHFEDASQQQKFLRLMGGLKKGNKPIGSEEVRANMALGKEGQQRLQQDLLVEFEQAQSRRMDFQNKGVGLGFSPQSNKKFFIDANASRSVRFDD